MLKPVLFLITSHKSLVTAFIADNFPLPAHTQTMITTAQIGGQAKFAPTPALSTTGYLLLAVFSILRSLGRFFFTFESILAGLSIFARSFAMCSLIWSSLAKKRKKLPCNWCKVK
jgi:hypothetical protein